MFELDIDDSTALRLLDEADTEELFALVDANRDHLREWLPWVDANTEPGHTRRFIESVTKQHEDGLGFTCAIVRMGRIVGVIGFHPIDRDRRSVEIGYWLSREEVGKGIMTRCCRALVDHAFDELGLERVVIPAAVGNARSRAVPERLGFVQVGILPDAEVLHGLPVDHVRYGMGAERWRRGRRGADRPAPGPAPAGASPPRATC